MTTNVKKVLVVGGAGYIGGAVTDELLKRGMPFAVYDNLTYENHYLKPAEFYYGDIRDRERLAELLVNFSHVVWLAAIVGDPACALNPGLAKEINQDAIAWLAENYNGRIIFTSTCSVYGASDEPVNEDSPINPLSIYAETKYAAEAFLLNKNSLIFRLGTAFGVSDNFSRVRMDLGVNVMTMNAFKRGYLEVYGGKQWRPFIHVHDIAQAIVNNLDSDKCGIYNLATINSTILDIAQKIKAQSGCEIKATDQKFQDNRNYKADCARTIAAGIIQPGLIKDIDFGISQIKQIVQDKRVNNLEAEYYSNVKRLGSIMQDYINKKINK